MLEVLELLGYFTAFWYFLFSEDFRARQIEEFRAAGWVGRFFRLLEGGVAVLCGLAPFAVLSWIA